ncbi:MAG: response regulator [Syntrophobacteraceae bacterium]
MSATVLIVDDELPFVETLTKRLTKRNVHILSASSGPDALDVLAREPAIDLVILDVKMPGMDGIQTLRQIKATHPRVEVVMLTGHAAMETALEGMRLGALDYLTKPCSIDQIMEKLSEAEEKRKKS